MSDALFLLVIGAGLLIAGLIAVRVTGRKKLLFPLLAIGAIAILDAVVLPFEEADDRWLTDLTVARQRAKEEGKPLIVDCWARWCASCLELGKITFKDPEVARRLDQFVAVKLDMDADANQEAWETFGIQGLPWVGFFSWDGQPDKARTLLAFEAPEAFAARLDRALGVGGEGAADQDADIATRLAESGLIWTLLFVFLAGFAVSLTPCVYPMIPITMMVIGTRETEGLAERLALSFTFVGGLALTYTALGLIAGLTGAGFGTAMQNPWVTGSVAVLFLAMALSYLDLFTLQLPGGLQDRLSGTGRAGFLGAILMGLVSGLVAAPCAGPVTVAILAHIAQTRDPVIGVTLMLAFSLGLGLIFVVIGTSTELTRRLPRQGPWMDTLKLFFAVALFVLGFYYLGLALPFVNLPFEWLAGLNPLG
jgi:thiol:disulfide interchange protein